MVFIRINKIWEYLSKPKYEGYFTYTGFLREYPQLFIILGFFCAFAFYIYSYTKDKAITNVSVNNLPSMLFNNQSDLFIQISLASSFIIIVLITWVILSEVIGYNDKESLKKKFGKDPEIEEIKLNFYDESVSILKRYFFVFIFYSLIFYNISYLVFSYIPSLKFLVLITSVSLQIFLIYRIHSESQLNLKNDQGIIVFSNGEAKANIKNKDFKLERLALLLISIIIIAYFIINPNAGYLSIFFSFPLLLLVTLVYLATSEVTVILFEIATSMGINQKAKAAPVNALLFVFVVVIILLVGNFASFNYLVKDPIIGNWSSINGKLGITFSDDSTISWINNGSISTGYWIKITGTCDYKLLFEDENIPSELFNKTVMVYNESSDDIYALNDTGIWFIR